MSQLCMGRPWILEYLYVCIWYQPFGKWRSFIFLCYWKCFWGWFLIKRLLRYTRDLKFKPCCTLAILVNCESDIKCVKKKPLWLSISDDIICSWFLFQYFGFLTDFGHICWYQITSALSQLVLTLCQKITYRNSNLQKF